MTVTVTISRKVYAWLLVMSFLSPMAVAVANIAYTGYRVKQDDKRWCRLFADLDRPVDPRITDPAQRARTQNTVNRIHQLRIEHGCIDR